VKNKEIRDLVLSRLQTVHGDIPVDDWFNYSIRDDGTLAIVSIDKEPASLELLNKVTELTSSLRLVVHDVLPDEIRIWPAELGGQSRLGRRRDRLKDSTLRSYHARAERRLDDLLRRAPPTPAGRALRAQTKRWRAGFFVFLQDRSVPATNNAGERALRPSVVALMELAILTFRGVTGGARGLRLPFRGEDVLYLSFRGEDDRCGGN
jgi:hypothetical protein